MYDLIIKSGLIVDGSGLPPFAADLAIADGRLTKIGRVEGDAVRTIEAEGCVVAPGFIGPHTRAMEAAMCGIPLVWRQ